MRTVSAYVRITFDIDFIASSLDYPFARTDCDQVFSYPRPTHVRWGSSACARCKPRMMNRVQATKTNYHLQQNKASGKKRVPSFVPCSSYNNSSELISSLSQDLYHHKTTEFKNVGQTYHSHHILRTEQRGRLQQHTFPISSHTVRSPYAKTKQSLLQQVTDDRPRYRGGSKLARDGTSSPSFHNFSANPHEVWISTPPEH